MKTDIVGKSSQKRFDKNYNIVPKARACYKYCSFYINGFNGRSSCYFIKTSV